MLPSGLICASPWVWWLAPPAGQAAPAQPTPVLTTPGELPGLRYLCFQPNLSVPRAYSRCRMGLGSFFSRNSTGSRPSFTARSSIADSMPKDAGGFPGARKARADPALTTTAVCLTRVFGTL